MCRPPVEKTDWLLLYHFFSSKGEQLHYVVKNVQGAPILSHNIQGKEGLQGCSLLFLFQLK